MTYRGNTDRRFNDWHYDCRRDWSFIDLDGIEACRRCHEPLLLYEVSRDPKKKTSIIQRLAAMSGVPAVLMIVPGDGAFFTDDTVVKWRYIADDEFTRGSLAEWSSEVSRLRAIHDFEKH